MREWLVSYISIIQIGKDKDELYLICDASNIRIRHTELITLLAKFNTELEMDRADHMKFWAEFNSEQDYESYLSYCKIVA